jgi:hypothetical protein
MHTLTTAGGIVDADHTVHARIQHRGTHQTQVLSFALTLDDQGTQFSQDLVQPGCVGDLKIFCSHKSVGAGKLTHESNGCSFIIGFT